jgi:hypothetical protein
MESRSDRIADQVRTTIELTVRATLELRRAVNESRKLIAESRAILEQPVNYRPWNAQADS